MKRMQQIAEKIITNIFRSRSDRILKYLVAIYVKKYQILLDIDTIDKLN